jgi:rubrerythrin
MTGPEKPGPAGAREQTVRRQTVREEGGDPVCWAGRVCPACGRLADEEPPTRCPACGRLIDPP